MKKIFLTLMIFVLKTVVFAQPPNWIWADRFGNTQDDAGHDVTTDLNGNIYVTGSFRISVTIGSTTLTSAGGEDIFVAKFNSSGIAIWAASAGGTGNENGSGITVDAAGNVYITGAFASTSLIFGSTVLTNAGSRDFFVAKYNSSGVLQWAVSNGGPGYDQALSAVTDGNGNVYIVGNFNYPTVSLSFGSTILTNAGSSDGFIAKYNSSGNPIWATSIGGTDIEGIRSIKIDAAENFYVSGSFFSPSMVVGSTTLINSGSGDMFVVKFNSSGSVIWANAAGGTLGENVGEVAVDASGNVYVTGDFASITMNFGAVILNQISPGNNFFLVKYNSSGTAQWATAAGGNSVSGGSVFCNASGNIYVVGNYWDLSVNFGGHTINNSSGWGEIFLVMYNSSGVAQWALSVGGVQDDWGVGTIDANGNIYLTGVISLVVNFGSISLTSAGGWDIFIAKLSQGCTAAPPQPGTITGNTTVCQNSSQTYSVAAVPGATSYTWTYPQGGGWTGNSTTNSINLTVGTNSGNITVTANNNCGSSTPQTLAVTVNPVPPQPGTITGNTSPCSGSSQTYSISAVSGATSYTWTLPTGGGWTGTSTTNSINATVGTNSGNITVTANNSCGNSTAQTLAVTVNTSPAQPGAITGNTSPCSGSSQTYSVAAVPGATTYTWILPTGGGWAGTSTTNSINATVGTNGGNICVTANNSCGSSTPQCLVVTINSTPAQPGAITGSASPCSGTSQTYSVAAVPGATSYTWTLPTGGGWTGTSTTNSINATVGTNSGNISVTANNSCGNSTAQTLAVTVNTSPSQPGVITGGTAPCSGTSQTYSVASVPGATSYTWTLPSGWTGTSTTNSINATVGTNSGNISVTANNICGNSAAQTLAVTVNTTPAQPGSITGNITVNVGQNLNYSIGAVSGATGYNWSLSGGGSITSGQNTTSISINWTTAGNYTLSVNAGNSCGNSTDQTLNITVSTVTGTIDPNNPFQIKIGPNPSSGDFYLTAKGAINKKIRIEILNLSGQIVYTKEQTAATNDYSMLLSLNKLSVGVYKVKIFIDKKVYLRSIAKMN